MGRRATGTVEPRQSTIRLKFTYRGKRCVETLDLEPTPANIKAAERLLAKVTAAIFGGYYDRREFFTTDGPAAVTTFKDYAEGWLKIMVVEKSTRRSYQTALDASWNPAFGDKPLAQIRYSDLKRAIAERAAVVSGKTVNNHLVVLRGVFDVALKDGLIATDPTKDVSNLKHQAPEPDPFDREETELVLQHMATQYPEPVWNYYAVAFHTGLRPSEQILAGWPDVDWRRKKLRISKARVDWEDKGTKTNRIREVSLNDEALAALRRQKAHTFMKAPEGPIFHNPSTGRPWADEQVQRRNYFNPTLRALGLRHRDAYQTRHTFATTLLMGGINVGYIAKQLGHSNIMTTLTKYARWIEGADGAAEAAKANALLSRKSPREGTND